MYICINLIISLLYYQKTRESTHAKRLNSK